MYRAAKNAFIFSSCILSMDAMDSKSKFLRNIMPLYNSDQWSQESFLYLLHSEK